MKGSPKGLNISQADQLKAQKIPAALQAHDQLTAILTSATLAMDILKKSLPVDQMASDVFEEVAVDYASNIYNDMKKQVGYGVKKRREPKGKVQ